jgi:GNAT superfamily N-acetyltransferase
MRAFMDDDFNMLVKVPSTVIKTYREKSQWELVRWFMMKTGAIRAHPETGGLYLCKPPTSSQYRAIREWSDWFSPQAAPLSGTGVIIEYDPTCGDCGEGHFTKEFHAGEATERIVSVIELMIDGLTRKKNPAGTSMEDQWKSYIQKAVGKNRVKFDNNYTVFRDDEGKPTGTVELYFEYPKGTRPATVYLSLIAVPPEHRRRGHGTTMLSLLTQFADNQGWRIAGFVQAWGGVNLGQGALVRWYKKFGFKVDTEGGMVREPMVRKTP